MKKTGSQYIFFIVFLIFGIVVSMQFKSTISTKRLTASNTLSVDMLKEQLTREQKKTEELKAAIDQNLVMQNEIIKAYIDQQNDVQLSDEWERIKLSTGLVDLKGSGITIKLDDAPVRQPDTPVGWQIIHDQDIKVILNDLKIAGAQAIAINGERIVPMSEQLCAGPTIRINGNRYPVPYYIEVIGDPDELFESISKSRRITDMAELGIRVEIKRSKELTLAKFSGADELDRYISGLEVIEK